jgi:MoaA/NifB/PqqE/SkfB family radical SAM enzyme
LNDLRLQVENRGDLLMTEASGFGSGIFAPFIKNYFRWLNKLGPVAIQEGRNIYSLYVPPIPSEAHANYLRNFLQTWLYHKPTPQAATIALNYECQCNCIHCSIPSVSAETPILSTEEVEKIIKESIDLGVTHFTLTGGEPLLRDDLEDCISFVPKRQAVIQVFSNGLALDAKRAARLKAAGLFGLIISLDSPDPEEHDRLRSTQGCFRAVKRAVRYAREAGLLVGLSTYATNGSSHEGKLAKLAALAADWGVHEITVLDVIPTGRLIRRDDLLLTEKSRQILMREGRAIYKKYKGRPRIVTQTFAGSGFGFAKSIGCLAGSYEFHVTAYGDFTPCDFTPLKFGNVRTESLAQLWNKLTNHPVYCQHAPKCRMQSPEFREKYIHKIPEHAPLPFPITEIETSA